MVLKGKRVKCEDCVRKFRCLSEEHIPENYGNDCGTYEKGSPFGGGCEA